MQKYKSHKIVEAMKIAVIEPLNSTGGAILVSDPGAMTARDNHRIPVTRAYLVKHEPKPGGYYVRYPDGYESFSPAEAFESGYTPVDAYPTREETLTTGQPKITGYRNLTPDEVALINEGKALAERCGEYIAKLRGFAPSPPEGAPAPIAGARPTLDQRWISIGATDLQKGWMSVIRGIAQPTSF